MNKVVYLPNNHLIYDVVVGKTASYGESLSKIKKKYPDASVWTSKAAHEDIEKYHLCKPAEEISEETYIEMLEVLPPMRWENTSIGEVFALQEPSYENIHLHFCKINNKHYRLLEKTSTAGKTILNKCKKDPNIPF
jgi:hypothetical protein